MATPTKKTTYDPKAQYHVLKGTVSHKGDNKTYSAGDGQTFDMAHRTAKQIKYLVEVTKVIGLVSKQ